MPKPHILIVEDDAGIRETLRSLLEMENFRVSTAENGAVALALMGELGNPCLILLDLMMPVMNGWEFLQKVRAAGSAFATIPIAVVSAAADLAELERAGCSILKKPPDIDQLLEIAHRHCSAPS